MDIKMLFGSLNEDGLQFTIRNLDIIRETNACYVINSRLLKRLKKEQLNKIFLTQNPRTFLLVLIAKIPRLTN